jgi:hypothetical protein
MEHRELTTQSPDQPVVTPKEEPSTVAGVGTTATLPSPADDAPCSCGRPGGRCVCGAAHSSSLREDMTTSYPPVYAIGRLEARFPTTAIEKEFVQAAGRADTAGLTDRQLLRDVLSKPENRYLVRQLCYVLSIEGVETYVLQPRDPTDFDLLVDGMRSDPTPMDVDVVIGVRGPIAPPELCNGLMVPIVAFDQLYSFDRGTLIKSIPRPDGMTAKQFEPAATDLFDRIVQVADNAGATDEHRALNYLAVRYSEIYARAAEQFAADYSLTGVEVLTSPLSGVRKIVDVVFAYTNRNTDFTERFSVRVDVTEEFPFLVTKLSPYYTR